MTEAMKIFHIILCLFLFLQGATVSQAQEMLLPLSANPTKIKKEYRRGFQSEKNQYRVLTLPFRDDFSYRGPYPDQGLWADRNVFVNSSFAVHPKTIGTATFDAFDQYGNLYEHLTPTNTPLAADELSSHHIRLDSVFSPVPKKIGPGDGVVFSFYYQPQGNGGDPLRQDSLVLQFLHTPGHYTTGDDGEEEYAEDLWQTVWLVEGLSLKEFSNDTFPYFKRVAIQITDPVYFREDFRFRFRNHVSFPLPGNPSLQNYTGSRSVWNIDYVYLNVNRDPQQTSYFDIAFASPARSILARYAAMPWSHYILNPQAHLKSNLSVNITNLDNAIYPYSYRYYIQDENGNIIRNYSGGTWNIAPFSTHGYQEYQPHASPIVIPNPLPAAPAVERHFDIVHVIRAGIAGDNNQQNDTIAFRQSFGNYFAYDDGTPEAGYGVTGRFPQIAKRYVAAKQDKISAIDIYLNQTIIESNTDRPFKITLWKSIHPSETILYQSEDPIYTDPTEEMNRFVRYELSRAVEVSDTFYVGLEQQGNVSINEFLSIGFDTGNDAGRQIFYNSGAGWMQSIYKGALMIRPVFDSDKTVSANLLPEAGVGKTTLYPNPVTGGQMTIWPGQEFAAEKPLQIDVFDIYGKLVYSGEYRQSLNTLHMANGLYYLRIIHPGGKHPETIPFIIAR